MKLITSDGREYENISRIIPSDENKLKFYDDGEEFMFEEYLRDIVAIKDYGENREIEIGKEGLGIEL